MYTVQELSVEQPQAKADDFSQPIWTSKGQGELYRGKKKVTFRVAFNCFHYLLYIVITFEEVNK